MHLSWYMAMSQLLLEKSCSWSILSYLSTSGKQLG
jgi:hypothetical protein